MKWLLGAVILVGVVLLWTLQDPADAPNQSLKSVLEVAPQRAPDPAWTAMPDDNGDAMAERVRMDQSQDLAPASD